jgi:predicted esterase
MSSQHFKIKTSQTGHIYTRGNPEQADYYWMAFHGYGQLAENLLYKFESLSPEQHYIVAPEGLSRFYWKGVSEQPVASWMTRLDRQDEIADYVEFIDRVYQNIGWQKQKHRQRILFGFSQGCATLWRWMLNTRPEFDHLILWAGWLPEDMLYAPHLEYLQEKNIHFIHGDEDQFLTPERFNILKQRFANEKIPVIYHSFRGSHLIPRLALKIVTDLILFDRK